MLGVTFVTPIAPVTALVTPLATAVSLIPPLSSELYTGRAIIHFDSTKLYIGCAKIQIQFAHFCPFIMSDSKLRLVDGDEFGERDSKDLSELLMVVMLMMR